MKALATAAILFCLSGCATTTTYYRAGGTDEELQRDSARCRNQVAMLPTPAPVAPDGDAMGLGTLGAGLGARANKLQVMYDCMRAQGWTREK